jgi:hypothetical protein
MLFAMLSLVLPKLFSLNLNLITATVHCIAFQLSDLVTNYTV